MLTAFGFVLGAGVIGWAAFAAGYSIGQDDGWEDGYERGKSDERKHLMRLHSTQARGK